MRSRKISLQRVLGWLAVLNLAMLALLLANPSFSNASRPLRGIYDPVLALQLAGNADDVDAVLGDAPSPDREAMRFKQYVDFAFIASYAALYLVLSVLLARNYAWGRTPAIAASVCVLAAAGFAIAGNFVILRICGLPLNHTTQSIIDTIRYVSLAKFGLATVATGLLASYFVAGTRWGMRLVGLLNGLAVLLGLAGFVAPNFFTYAGISWAAGLLGMAGMFFRPGMR